MSASYLLELDISFVLDKRSLPRHTPLAICQLQKEFSMGFSVNLQTFLLAVLLALIGIMESVEPGMSGMLPRFAYLKHSPILLGRKFRVS
jgi:hypothetical protein